jgi:D-arginine dehydrogenase
MSETADVVVVGAGFAGAATAYHLTARGLTDVIVLEREPRPGEHASGKNAALAFQLMENLDEARLALEGLEFYGDPPEGFAARPLLRRCGSILVAGERVRAGLREAAGDAATLGVAVRFLEQDELLRRIPPLRGGDAVVGLENATDAVVDIAALLGGYLAAAERGGMRLATDEAVVEIGRANGRVSSVVTTKRTIETRLVVNAAGPWAGKVAKLARVPARSIAPRRRHLYEARTRATIDAAWPFVWHAERDVYFRPDRGGLLLSPCDATPHLPAAPEVDPAVETQLREKAAAAFPGLLPLEDVSPRACLRTFVSDGRFVIGPDPELEGFLWVAALGGHGMSTSYGVGRIAAAAALGERTPELDAFSPARLPEPPEI